MSLLTNSSLLNHRIQSELIDPAIQLNGFRGQSDKAED